MTIALPDLEVIEHLDFDLTPPCEHSEHGDDRCHSGPAYVIVRAADCTCTPGKTLYLCEGFWRWVQSGTGGLECRNCGDNWTPASQAYIFVQKVGI